MKEMTPAIPAWLAHLPVQGNLVVPWITARAANGGYRFGAVDEQRQAQALTERRCGVCGRPHDRRLVLLMRLSDLPRQRTAEPAVHPQCLDYTERACPMVAGTMAHYRSTPAHLDAGAVHASDMEARLGQPAEPWFAVWLAAYDTVVDVNNGLAASYARHEPLRIRSCLLRG